MHVPFSAPTIAALCLGLSLPSLFWLQAALDEHRRVTRKARRPGPDAVRVDSFASWWTRVRVPAFVSALLISIGAVALVDAIWRGLS
jgi:hypothetical protein